MRPNHDLRRDSWRLPRLAASAGGLTSGRRARSLIRGALAGRRERRSSPQGKSDPVRMSQAGGHKASHDVGADLYPVNRVDPMAVDYRL